MKLAEFKLYLKRHKYYSVLRRRSKIDHLVNGHVIVIK